MVLFFAAVCAQPLELVHCGRRWTTSSSADCACQMQLPKAFVFRQLIFGINANPHYNFIQLASFATRCGRVEAFLRSVVRILPVIEQQWIFCPYCPCLFSALSQVCLGTICMSLDAHRIFLRGSAAKPWLLRCHCRRDYGPRTGSEAASSSSQLTICRRALVGAATQLAPSISPATRHNSLA